MERSTTSLMDLEEKMPRVELSLLVITLLDEDLLGKAWAAAAWSPGSPKLRCGQQRSSQASPDLYWVCKHALKVFKGLRFVGVA